MKRVCEKGHEYFKTSDCPTCPRCEKAKVDYPLFMKDLSAPAKRALISAGIQELSQLSRFTTKDLLNLHGFGPSSIPKLQNQMDLLNINFKID